MLILGENLIAVGKYPSNHEMILLGQKKSVKISISPKMSVEIYLGYKTGVITSWGSRRYFASLRTLSLLETTLSETYTCFFIRNLRQPLVQKVS